MSEEPVFDREEAMRDLEGEDELFQEVVEIFLEDTPKIIDRLKTAVAAGDRDRVLLEAHSIKSSSCVIGGKRLGAVAARLEDESREGDLDNASELLREIILQFANLQTAIRADKS